MVVGYPTTMKTYEIKNQIKARFGISVRATSTLTKNPFFTARIRPTEASLKSYSGTLEYPAEFPVAFRQACLATIYGIHSPIAQQVCAGNVRLHAIAMRPDEWDAAFNLFDARKASLTTV